MSRYDAPVSSFSRPTWAFASAAASIVFLLAGCAALRQLDFQRPTVDLETIEIRSLDLEGGALTLWLDVFNPNEYEIRGTQVETILDLEEVHFGRAWLEQPFRVAAGGRTTIEVPAEFTWEGLGAGARAILQYGAVNYDLRTLVRLQTPVFQRTVELNKRGRVPIVESAR